MILTVTELRGHVTSGLADGDLQRLLDAAEDDITRVAGPLDSATEYRPGGHDSIVLDQRPSAVASVKEMFDTPAVLTLASNDYRVEGYILWRLWTGTNPRYWWWGRVQVIHTPVQNLAERQRAQIALVKLDLSVAGGVTSERIGDYSVGYGSVGASYQAQRANVLAGLQPAMVR
jgi:hypothetical protein